MNEQKQKLVDICFEMVITMHQARESDLRNDEPINYFNGKSTEEIAKWVADQLRSCGFDTEPCGGSWGLLKKRNP